MCVKPVGKRAIGGENLQGDPGYVQIVDCATGAEGPGMSVEVGWSQDPNAKVQLAWRPGQRSHRSRPQDRHAPGRRQRRLRDCSRARCRDAKTASAVTPAGHRLYAATWFSLAAIALIIYGFALRKRWRRAKIVTAELHRLGNGIAVAVDPLPGAESAAIGLYAMVGSRSEPEHLSGLAHLVEHMVFKGAGPRNTRAFAEAIENVGGSINAWTARDQTVFYGRTLARDAALLTELIADLVRAPHISEEHLEREKDVILSELGEVVDSPDDLVHDHLFEAAFEGQPLGRSVLGRAETLRAATRDDCLNWIRDELVPRRLILSASGKVDADQILRLAEKLFGDLEPWPGVPIGSAEFTGGVRSDRRRFEQAHWCLGLPGMPASIRGCRRCRSSFRRSAAECRRACSRSCARSAASLIRSAPGTRPSPTPALSR